MIDNLTQGSLIHCYYGNYHGISRRYYIPINVNRIIIGQQKYTSFETNNCHLFRYYKDIRSKLKFIRARLTEHSSETFFVCSGSSLHSV